MVATNSLPFFKHYTQGRMTTLGFAVLLGIGASALDQVVPFGLKILLDRLATEESSTKAFMGLLPMVGATLLSALLLFWQRYLIITRSRDVEMEIRNDLFTQLQNQPKQFFDHHPVGDLMSRVANDVDRVREMLGPGMLHMARMSFGFLYAGLALIWISPRMALIGLGSSLLLPLVSLHFRKKMQLAFKQTSERLSAMSVLVQEVLGGIHVIKSLGRESHFNERFQNSSQDFLSESLRVARQTSLVWPVINLISGVSLCISIYYGALLVTRDELSVGSLAASILFLVRVQFPLVGLGWVATMIQRGLASLERITELKFQMQTTAQESGPARTQFSKIEIRHLSFGYGSSECVIHDIHLELSPRKHVGIVGETGSGKTTLLHVLSGIEPPPPQTILLDGVFFEDLPHGVYSSLFALAPQDGFLFSESIQDNIELGKQPFSTRELWESVQAAGLESDLKGLPDGLNTLLGEKGVNLSGGQKQRVGLARALRSSTPILLLDDTLSAVDTQTESHIIQHLRSQTTNQCTVIVSHRYSAVVHCDEILVLEQGVVVERGTHTALIKKNGLYKKTWDKQKHHE